MKKCKEGHYYCFQDSKCKPIPKGYRRGVGGYLRREREDEKEDSKENGNGNGKSNGSSNGNGNGGNGGGNGNGGSGGNGGGNGSGGVGESVEIQNSDGETTAVVVDIIGPAHMRPRLNGNGVWKGTHIAEAGKSFGGYLDGIIINPSGSRNKFGLPDNMKPEGKTKEVPLTPSQNRLLVSKGKKNISASHKPEGELTEYVAAIPKVANIAVKAAPYIMTGVGALGTYLQMARPRSDGSTNDRKNLRPDLEAELRKKQKEREDKIKATTPNLDDKLNTPLVDKENEFRGSGKQIDAKTRRRMNAPEDQFNSYDPLIERKMTEKEKRKDDRLKKKYDKSDMKKSMQKQYGKEEGEKVYFATIRKQAMEEEKHKDHEPEMIRNQLKTAKRASKRIKKHTLKKDNFKAWVQSKITKATDYLDTAADYLDSKDDMKEELDKKDKPYIKKLVKNLRKGSKTHAKQADKLEKAMNEGAIDPNKFKDLGGPTPSSGGGGMNKLPGPGGGGGGTNAITMKATGKSFKNRILDIGKLATTPARFLLNIKSPEDPLSKFASPTDGMNLKDKISYDVGKAIKDFKKGQGIKEESNPRIPRKKGQPANSKKHSDLYTDENPKGTIHGLGFKDVATAKASVAKIRKSNRSHAHKIQAAVAMEQRAREMGKTSEAAVYRKFINSMKKKTKK